jgi:electron transfer flavoprotein beta subunit
MKILTLLKRVPDTAAKIRVAGDGKRIDPAGVEFVINPYDEIALEQAIRVKEAGGGHTITVLCLGTKEATKEIRTALAMGADEGVLLVDEAAERDAAGTAATLATAVAQIGPDLVLCGWKAVDTDDGAVPHLLAGRLGFPCVTMVTKFALDGATLTLNREVEGAEEVVSVKLPAVVSVQKGLAEPRYTSLKGIMMAKKKTIVEKPGTAVEPKVRVLALLPPPERKAGRIVGQGAEAVGALVQALSEEQKLI